MAIDWKTRITLNHVILAGKPTIRGLRLSVEHILRALANGISEKELLAEYPDLEPDDLRACLAYSADMIASERVYPMTTRIHACKSNEIQR